MVCAPHHPLTRGIVPSSGLHAFVAERAGMQSRRYSLCELPPVAQRASSAWSEVQRAVDTSAADATHRFKGSVAMLTMTFEPRPVLGTGADHSPGEDRSSPSAWKSRYLPSPSGTNDSGSSDTSSEPLLSRLMAAAGAEGHRAPCHALLHPARRHVMAGRLIADAV